MKTNNVLLSVLTLFTAIGLFASISPVVRASPLPPSSLPIENVFAIPKGANSYVDGDITVITKDIKYQVGSIFSTESNKIDLNQSFHAEMYVYLGNKRAAAADGMTFVMHADEERIQNFTGGVGGQLGVYAKSGLASETILQQQIKKSFAIEFDTYLNDYSDDKFDKGVSSNGGKGHVAYSFPDVRSSYTFKYSNGYNQLESLVHQNIYYPTDYLSNDKWHTFSVEWNADAKILIYTFGDAPAVRVAIDPAIVFGTNSVYWGFTGSTGGSSQESKVAFKQIPGLVNLSSSMKIMKNGKDITNAGLSGADGDVKVQYDLKYNGGKQNLLKPVFNLDLDNFLSFRPGTLTVNGNVVSDDYFVNGKLNYSFTKDLTATENTITVSFEGTPKIFTDKDVRTNINYSLRANNYEGNKLTTTFPITKSIIVKRDDFENQSWLINEINRQLTPKKIDVDVYEPDLTKITSIDIASGPVYPTERIPKTINKLKKLSYLHVINRNLTGSLPTELGDLTEIKTLSISGNTFDGQIPSSLGKLTQVELLALNNNHLKGMIPGTIGLLPKLKKIYLNDNPLSGQLPDFSMNLEHLALNNTQISYNLANVPTFLTNVDGNNYTNTFIDGLKLIGNTKISSKNIQIKPFDESDTGYFNLKAIQGDILQELYSEHIYTIKNSLNGTVYYKGARNIEVTIPYENDISYTVILDEAEKNPNNVSIILGKERVLKFAEIPISISLKMKLGSEKQSIIPEGSLTIFDDRENKNWKLSITTSELRQGQKKLQGEYSYTSKEGISQPIASGQKFLLETGKSDSINEVIPISNGWTSKYGLSYSAYSSNYVGNYSGSVNWTLEDAP